MGRRQGWMKSVTGRLAMRSPGYPPYRREVERRFWLRIADGLSSDDAADAACGVSSAVGSRRWFRQGEGMAPLELVEGSGRYLSFAEREEIALAWERGEGVRAIAESLGRSPSTISRELRRNAATRSGTIAYRASVAQCRVGGWRGGDS